MTYDWRICRMAGLGSDLASFNLKLLHGLLVTRQRLHHLTPAASARCAHCDEQIDEDLHYALIHCNYNNGTGENLLRVAQIYIPGMSAASLLHLELVNMDGTTEYFLVTLISACLMCIWDKRYTRVKTFDTRATLEARCLLLRKNRFANHATK